MVERVKRGDDESLYQPKIHSRHIRRLHQIGIITGEPLTVMIDLALREYEARYAEIIEKQSQNTTPLLRRTR